MYMQRVVGPEDDEPAGELIKVSMKTEPGSNAVKTVPVEKGTYRMWCSFMEHAKEGMETHITVE